MIFTDNAQLLNLRWWYKKNQIKSMYIVAFAERRHVGLHVGYVLRDAIHSTENNRVETANCT